MRTTALLWHTSGVLPASLRITCRQYSLLKVVIAKSVLLMGKSMESTVLPGTKIVLFDTQRQTIYWRHGICFWKCVFISWADILSTAEKPSREHNTLEGSRGRMWQGSARCDIWQTACFQWPGDPARYSHEFSFMEGCSRFQVTWLKSWACSFAPTGS